MKPNTLIATSLLLMSIYKPLQAQTAAASGYKIADKIKLEGDGGWDYLTVDESTSRLFVSHGTQVQIVDLKARKQIGAIQDLKGVHGIAIANDLGKGYISCGKDSSVVIFDLKSYKVMGTVKVTGKNPDAILYDQ
ncbi:MAG TPA: hypothetical protein VNX68_05265, partial [Nitrosopumilaceae archaeon]|nr:hypothetical protein [Nitrosopumilaceae archaeon]